MDGGDIIQATMSESPPNAPSSEERSLFARSSDDNDYDLRDIFNNLGPPSLVQSSSTSTSPSPLPSLGIDSTSAISCNLSSASGVSHQHRHRIGDSRPVGLKTRQTLSTAVLSGMEYVHYTLTGLEVGAKYRQVQFLFLTKSNSNNY